MPTRIMPVVRTLLQALRELPDLQAELVLDEPTSERPGPFADAVLTLNVAGGSAMVLVEAKKEVYPRDVRQAVWQLRDAARAWAESNVGDVVLMLAAESISPGAKELLRRERVGYHDRGGSLYLPAPGIYLFIDKPPPEKLARSIRSLFHGRRAQVLHALLMHREVWHGVTALAQLAKVSPATASQMLTELGRFDWLATRGEGPRKERQLRDATALLDAWGAQVVAERPPALRRFFVPASRPDQLPKHLAAVLEERGVDYAISHEAAAQRLAPFLSTVSQVRVRLLPEPAADDALSDLDARPVTEGANLVVLEAKSDGELLFRELVDGIWWASPIQIYLDLLRGEGRAKGFAAHFRKERIGC